LLKRGEEKENWVERAFGGQEFLAHSSQYQNNSKKVISPNVVNSMDEVNAEWTAHSHVWKGYVYKVRVILHGNLHRESHNLHGPPTSVT
jgi:hypothetical protein